MLNNANYNLLSNKKFNFVIPEASQIVVVPIELSLLK